MKKWRLRVWLVASGCERDALPGIPHMEIQVTRGQWGAVCLAEIVYR